MTNVFSKLSKQNDPSIEIWEPLNVKHFGLDFEKGAAKNYESSNFLKIRNKETKKILKPTSINQVQIYAGNTKRMLRLFPLVYYAFNHDEAPKTQAENEAFLVVLKNKDDDKHLDNLERLTRGEHSRKIRARTKNTRKSVVCKRVQISEVKEGNDQTLKGKEYESAEIAEIELGLPKGSVSNSCRRGDFAGGQFRFAYVLQELLPDEEFKEYKGIEVSNKGRVKLTNGKITRGTPERNTRYHQVYVKLEGNTEAKKYYVHTLVWQAWNGRDVAKGSVVCHNESISEEERLICGYERNWSTDLREGTPRENSQESHDKRKDLIPVLHDQSQTWYQCANKAAKDLDLHPGCLHKVCRGERTHTGGQTFRFAKEVEKDILYTAVANGTFKWGDEWVNPAESQNETEEDNQNETEELSDDVTPFF